MESYLNFSDMKAADIKTKVIEIQQSMKKYIKDNSIDNIINCLRSDERKSVQKFADKLEKSKEKYFNELNRVKTMYDFDKSFGEYEYIAGVDEVGRGPLAGPIVAAAVILDLNYKDDEDLLLGIKDSKKLSLKAREELYEIIINKAVDYKITLIDNKKIDKKGIAWCNNQIFIESIKGLKTKPDFVLSDGYAIKNFDGNNEAVIKGDNKSASIACASIIAKVYRDRLMQKYAEKFTQYDFQNNVGYGTRAHIEAIGQYGITEIHRKSFIKNLFKK